MIVVKVHGKTEEEWDKKSLDLHRNVLTVYGDSTETALTKAIKVCETRSKKCRDIREALGEYFGILNDQ